MERKKLVRKAEPPAKRGIAWPRWTGFRGMTLRNWLELLVVPLALVVIGLVFTMLQDARQQEIENQRAQQAQKIENQRAQAERELAEQQAQDEALQAYLDQMSQLMLERKLLEAEPGDAVHTLAQARSSTAILRLDSEHNESVTRFLSNSGLARSSEASPRLLSEITLSHAKLSGAYLREADLSGAYLREADLSYADLRDANLLRADLSEANLFNASLSEANLGDANLIIANLSGANLDGADLSKANLFSADLSYADLNSAKLHDVNLDDADLSGADLSNAVIWTEEQLTATASLKGATMPNGQKYEDWLKSRGEENGGSS